MSNNAGLKVDICYVLSAPYTQFANTGATRWADLALRCFGLSTKPPEETLDMLMLQMPIRRTTQSTHVKLTGFDHQMRFLPRRHLSPMLRRVPRLPR